MGCGILFYIMSLLSAIKNKGEKAKKFFYSGMYLFLLSLSVFLSWLFSAPYIGLSVISIMGTLTLLFNEDITPTMPLIVLAGCIFATDDIAGYLIYILVLIPLIISIPLHFIIYPFKIKLGKMFFPQLAISVALLLAGVGSIAVKNYLSTLFYSVLLGLVILLFYVLYYSYNKDDRDLKKKFFSKMMIFYGCMICVQLACYYFINKIPFSQWGKEWIDLGWAIDNNLATILLLTAPYCFYMSTQYKNKAWLFTAIGLIQYAAILFTFSRGGILFAAVTAPFVIGFTIAKSDKKQVIFTVGLFLAAALAVYFVKFNQINEKLLAMVAGIGESGSGFWANRDKLYREAIDVFLRYPINGAGMGYAGQNFEIGAIGFYWFHSTFFQIIGSMGSIGLLAYSFFYVIRYKIIIGNAKKELFGLFSLLALIGFELYSMIDTGTFVPVPMMILAMMITFTNEKKSKTIYESNI